MVFWDRKVHVKETQLLCVKVDCLQVEVTMQDCRKRKELLSFLRMFNFGVDENIEEVELRLPFLLTFLLFLNVLHCLSNRKLLIRP